MKKREDNPRRDRAGLPRCRVCGCTGREPCNPACGWAREDLCSHCFRVVQDIVEWAFAAHRPRIAPLLREYSAELKRQEAGGGG